MSSMLTTLSTAPSGFSARAARMVGAVGRAILTLGRALQNRHEVHRLLELDDRSLKDIGLTRSDVIGALSSRYRDDPSVWLRLRAVEQRASARHRLAAVRRRARELV